jgi:hypothetical protein
VRQRERIPASATGPSRCVDPNPPATPPVSGAHAPALSGHRFARTWTLDGGRLRVTPPPNADHGRLSYARARCTLLSARSAENFPILPDAEHSGFSLGLGVVSIRSGLAPVVVSTNPALADPPPARLPRRELAWIAVAHPTVVASCPARVPDHPPPAPSVTGYQVLILAATGYDGSLYVARAPAVCSPGVREAGFGRLVQNVSVPWRLVERSATAATLTVSPRRCDQVDDVAQLTGNVVTTVVSRPIESCTDGPSVPIGLSHVGTLPHTLRQAPVGALDVPEH